MKLNPNMTLKEMHDYCKKKPCRTCKYAGTYRCQFRDNAPCDWQFEEPPQVREVKRHAKEGEYIKVTYADFPERYSVGDVLLVVDDNSDSDLWRNKAVGFGKNSYVIRDENYVVLENYVPDQKETAPSAGDTENSGYKNTYGKSIGSEFQNVNTLIGINSDGSLIIKQLKPAANGGANE